MKTSAIMFLVMGIVGSSFCAANPVPVNGKDLTPEQKAERTARFKARQYAMTGGIVVKPGSQKGKIVIANAQKKMAQADIDAVVAFLRKETRLDIVCEDASDAEKPADALVSRKAGLVLKIIDVTNDPAVLVAPEDRWAVLNVAGLGKGLPDNALKDRLYASRCRKQLFRTFALLCGGCASQYPDNLTWAATIEGLDQYKEEMPMDIPDRVVKRVAALGVTPEIRATYKNACLAGWACPPTNDVEKVIWEKCKAETNTSPTNPMMITKPKK